MTHAYQEIHLYKVKINLAIMLDYAINTCKIKPTTFISQFLVSSVSRRIEKGNITYLIGKSGIELAREVIYETTNKQIEIDYTPTFQKTKEYWIGYVIAHYQWYKDVPFSEIFSLLSYEELATLYNTHHEADITKFIDYMDHLYSIKYKETRLKRKRELLGLTQNELAKLSNVSLRSIQMYEQRQKDINKASVITLYKLAKILNTMVEDLIEH